MALLYEKIIENHAMIDAVRIRKNAEATVELLKDDLGISRTTADKICAALLDDEHQILARTNRKLVLLGTVSYFLGISIGSKHIRVVLLDLNFAPFCFTLIVLFLPTAKVTFFFDLMVTFAFVSDGLILTNVTTTASVKITAVTFFNIFIFSPFLFLFTVQASVDA